MPKRPVGETLRHFEAFEFWYWLEPRALDKVAAHFGVSDTAVSQWAAKFRWDERAQERDAKLKATIADKNDGKAVRMRENLINVSEAVLARFAARLIKNPQERALREATLYEPTAGDAFRWGQMQMLLTGQATSRSEHTIGGGFVDAFFAVMGAVLRRELPRCCPSCKTSLNLGEKLGRAMLEASAKLQQEHGAAALPAPPAAVRGAGEDPDTAGPDEGG